MTLKAQAANFQLAVDRLYFSMFEVRQELIHKIK